MTVEKIKKISFREHPGTPISVDLEGSDSHSQGVAVGGANTKRVFVLHGKGTRPKRICLATLDAF